MQVSFENRKKEYRKSYSIGFPIPTYVSVKVNKLCTLCCTICEPETKNAITVVCCACLTIIFSGLGCKEEKTALYTLVKSWEA